MVRLREEAMHGSLYIWLFRMRTSAAVDRRAAATSAFLGDNFHIAQPYHIPLDRSAPDRNIGLFPRKLEEEQGPPLRRG